MKTLRAQLHSVFPHPGGERLYTRVEKEATPGWSDLLHPGVEKCKLIDYFI